MPSAQDCAERLREQAYKTLLPQIRDLEEELRSVGSSFSAGVQQIERKLEALRQIELPTTELVLEEILRDLLRQKDLETSDLSLFARTVGRKETQEEILTFLLDGAQKYFPRVALFAVRGDRFVGWSSRGFTEATARGISSDSFARSECPGFQDALEGEDPITAPDLPSCGSLESIQGEAQAPWHFYPLRVMQRPVAVLLAGSTEGASCNPDAFSIILALTALRLENIALKILYEFTAAKPQPAAPPPVPAETVAAAPPVTPIPEEEVPVAPPLVVEPEPEPEPEPVAEAPEPVFRMEPVPEIVMEAVPEPVIEPVPEPIMESFSEPIPEPAPLVEPPPPAVAVEEFGSWTDLPIEAPAPAPIPVAVPAPPPAAPKVQPPETQAPPGEERLHTDAKRFARLLVSEIKLYNERHVAEGRQNRDLYLRLKRDIDRSREMYEKRVSPTVSQKIDYFHDEIIRILGDNDPSTLGSDYPGPRVE